MGKIEQTHKNILLKLEQTSGTYDFINIIFLLDGDIKIGQLYTDHAIVYYNMNSVITNSSAFWKTVLNERVIILEETDLLDSPDKTKIYNHIIENYIEYLI